MVRQGKGGIRCVGNWRNALVSYVHDSSDVSMGGERFDCQGIEGDGFAGLLPSLLAKRELEFYIPEQVYVQAQNDDVVKEAAVRAIFAGDQSHKFRKAMSASGCHVPRGSELRRLLQTNLTRNNLDHEISNIIEEILMPWANNLKGN
jgi:hypothetical protein